MCGGGFNRTYTVTVESLVQPPLLVVTVYVVVTLGEKKGHGQLGHETPVVGTHDQAVAPGQEA